MYPKRFAILLRGDRIGRFVAGLLLALALVAASAPMAIAANPAYTVPDVAVDVTAETSAAAREVALAQGHVEAMRRLLKRLVPAEDLAKAPQLSAQEVANLVQAFEVDSERTSPVRYMADLTFEFRPAEVRELLRSRDLRFADAVADPLVVLPAYGDFDQLALWEESNPWRQAWLAQPTGQGLVPLVMPLGDLRDVSTVDARAAVSGDDMALREIARNYGAEGVLVAHAIPIGDFAAGAGSVRVSVSKYDTERQPSRLPETTGESYRQGPGEKLMALLARAARSTADTIQESWKERNVLRFDAKQTITAFLAVTSLADLQEIRRRLDRVGIVERTMISYVSKGGSMIDVTFIGDINQLAFALAEDDLSLIQDGFSDWEIRLNDQPTSNLEPVTE